MTVSSRHCSRCRLPLSDFASMERGMGPICANKDTHLYAKTIPANFSFANMYSLSIREEDIHPDVRTLWNETLAKLIRRTTHAANQEQNHTFNWTGEDLREIIKGIDYLLSWKHPNPTTETNLIKIVEHLGYVGLAGVLAGEASTGEAALWFENGEVKLQGSRNKAAYRAFAGVPGIKLPRATGQPYSAPKRSLDAFLDLVTRYYPMYQGDFDLVRQEAAAWVPPAPVVSAEPATTRLELANDTILIRTRSEDFTVQFTWMRHPRMGEFVVALKHTAPTRERIYDPITHIWRFKKVHLEAIQQVISSFGIFQNVEVQETGQVTPPNSYSLESIPSHNPMRNRRYRY